MIELSRRFFLGGAIALIAVKTFEPTISMASNMPQIVGDGKHDDSAGFNALFAKEPVIFSKEQIGIDGHEGIQIIKGTFKINRPLEILNITNFTVNRFEIDATDLDDVWPIIKYERGSMDPSEFDGKIIIYLKNSHSVPLFQILDDGKVDRPKNFSFEKFKPVIHMR